MTIFEWIVYLLAGYAAIGILNFIFVMTFCVKGPEKGWIAISILIESALWPMFFPIKIYDWWIGKWKR